MENFLASKLPQTLSGFFLLIQTLLLTIYFQSIFFSKELPFFVLLFSIWGIFVGAIAHYLIFKRLKYKDYDSTEDLLWDREDHWLWVFSIYLLGLFIISKFIL